MRFSDRAAAGRQLAARLAEYEDRFDVVVLALPRGGVPVAAEVASFLDAPLDVCVVRKLGVPGYPEVAMGAIGPGGVQVLNADVIERLSIPDGLVDEAVARERMEVQRLERTLRGGRPPSRVRDATVIVVDDGLATGATAEAAVRALGELGPAQIVFAVPVGPREARDRIRPLVDRFVCLSIPAVFDAVGAHYERFPQITDEEAIALLSSARMPRVARASPSRSSVHA
jgi:predicted phosphoribosyltransferase